MCAILVFNWNNFKCKTNICAIFALHWKCFNETPILPHFLLLLDLDWENISYQHSPNIVNTAILEQYFIPMNTILAFYQGSYTANFMETKLLYLFFSVRIFKQFTIQYFENILYLTRKILTAFLVILQYLALTNQNICNEG